MHPPDPDTAAKPLVTIAGGPLTPAWFKRASQTAQLTEAQQDEILRAMAQEFPVDDLLVAVVQQVDDAVAKFEKEPADPQDRNDPGIGEVAAVSVVLVIAQTLLGDYALLSHDLTPMDGGGSSNP